jgi:phage terminase large subunit-like protein
VSLADISDEELAEVLAGATREQSITVLSSRILRKVDCYFPQAREKQRQPLTDWEIWLILSGRGFGKTRTGAEWVVDEAIEHVGNYAVVGSTFADGRDICIEGSSDDGKPAGVLTVLERRQREPLTWNRSMGELRLANGSLLKVLSGDEPDRARGWNLRGAWCDELAAWRYPETFDQIQFALRVGERPRMVVTTTPRPTDVIRDLVKREGDDVVVTRGSTWENRENLSPLALARLEAKYAATRLGRQELEGELLEDVEGALWERAWIDNARVDVGQLPTEFAKVVVAIDPALTSHATSDETGIVAAGSTRRGYCPVCGSISKESRHAFVLADESCRESPLQWAHIAWQLYDRLNADRLVAERNGGYDLMEQNLRTVRPGSRFEMVNASRGKQLRAGPVADVYEQGSVHHVGSFPQLEDQLCTWDPEDSRAKSPDRLDALVYAITALDLRMSSPAATSARKSAGRTLGQSQFGAQRAQQRGQVFAR